MAGDREAGKPMKKLLILSGKGGTGKTTLVTAFIKLAQPEAYADCDVDAPNLHLMVGMGIEPVSVDYYGMDKAHILVDKCNNCGRCAEHCLFGGVELQEGQYHINTFACEGCGVCSYVCPQSAIEFLPDVSGYLQVSKAGATFATAQLKMGRGNSGKLVTAVKQAMEEQAPATAELAIIDGSPGIGCPVVASISGVDQVLVVAEPSLSGFNDLQRIITTTRNLQTAVAVCVNKYNLSLPLTEEIEAYCRQEGLPMVGRISYDARVSQCMNAGSNIIEEESLVQEEIKQVYQKLLALINKK